MKQAMISASRQSIVLADDRKAETDALVQYAEWYEVDYLIMNQILDTEKFADITLKTKIIYA